MPEEVIDYLRQAHPRRPAILRQAHPRRPAIAAPADFCGAADGRLDEEVVSLKEEARIIHEEARTVLPGIQALFGFQLIAVFNRPFLDLDPSDRVVHLAALLLVAIAIGLIMAPAAYHRLSEPGMVSRHWIELASRDIAWAMVALMVAIGLDVYLVALMISGEPALAVALGAASAAILGWLWFGVPLLRRRRRPR
jgi:hypothetical protein